MLYYATVDQVGNNVLIYSNLSNKYSVLILGIHYIHRAQQETVHIVR